MARVTTPGNARQVSIRHRAALLLGCTALIAFSPAVPKAQQAEEAADATVLETITVEGGAAADSDARTIVATQTTGGSRIPTDIMKMPASVSVVTAREIEQRNARTVEEVLYYTAGVTADFYGSDDRFDYFKIRGFDAWAYRDGLSLGDPFGGIREEPYAFERVEILKGANSTVFGVSDPGGSVNYTTKRPRSEKFGEVYATGGSFDHKEIGFDFGDNLTEDDTLSYRLTGKFQRSDMEYDYSQDDENFIMGGLTWRPTDMTSLTVVYDHLDRNGTPGSGGHPMGYDLDRSVFLGEPEYNYNDVNRNTVSVMFDHDFGTGLTFNSNARYSKSKSGFGYAYVSEYPDNGDNFADRYYFGSDRSDEDFIIDAHLLYDVSFGSVDSQTLVGAEYHAHSGDSDLYWAVAPPIDFTNPNYSGGVPVYAGPYSSTSSDQKTKALYLQQNLTFSDRLIVTAGLRNDWLDLEEDNRLTGVTSSDELSELSKRIGVTYRLTDEFAVYATYAESVAPPSVGVDPERGEQYEVGIKYRPDAFPALFTASVFDLTKNNVAVNVTDPVTGVITRSTIGEMRARGFELEAKAEIAHNWNVIAAYTYLDTEILEDGNGTNEGNSLNMVPEHAASVWINYLLEGNGPRGDMTFGLGARYMGAYYMDLANTAQSESAVVFDAAFTYKIQENTTFQLNVSNLFDEKHIANGGLGSEWYNPGRAVYATVRQTW